MGKIYIVAGHGAGDPGAIGNGYQEADVSRRIANSLKNKLSNAILYPTERNLYKTKDYSFFEKGGYVIEIHLNSAEAIATGTELLIKTGFIADATDKAIYNAMTPFFAARGIKTKSDLANMNNFANRGVKYSLLEICFINNANDMKTFEANYNKIINNLAFALGGTSISTQEIAETPSNTITKKGDFDNMNTEQKESTIRDIYAQVLGRLPSQSEVDSWIKKINSGTSFLNIYYGFLNSDEGRNLFIREKYHHLLDRNPDTAGLKSWKNNMANGTRTWQVLQGFLNSAEYKNKKK